MKCRYFKKFQNMFQSLEDIVGWHENGPIVIQIQVFSLSGMRVILFADFLRRLPEILIYLRPINDSFLQWSYFFLKNLFRIHDYLKLSLFNFFYKIKSIHSRRFLTKN
jgi:hypothetical protein